MKMKAPSPEQWQLLRRLQAAGCPLDLADVPPPDHPVRVSAAAPMRTNIFPMRDGIGIAVGVRIVATVSITIAAYWLEAPWLVSPVAWVEPCSEHRDRSCLTTGVDRHVSFDKVLNRRTLYSGRLKSGEFLQGFLVGTSARPLHLTNGELSATLWIRDVVGRNFPYALKLQNYSSALPSEPGPT